MTAHIDAENLETEVQECNPHDLNAMQRLVKDLHYSRAGWVFTACVSALFNVIFIFERVFR